MQLNHPTPDPRAVLAALPDGVDIGVDEVAALCGCCTEHISRLAKANKFPKPHRLGVVRRWNLGMVRKFLRDQAEKATQVMGGVTND